MLTKEWFNEAMPKQVATQDDYNQLVQFVTSWPKQSEGEESIYKFLTDLKENERHDLETKLMLLTESFLKFEIKKTNFISDILKDNKDNLSEETRKTLIDYGNGEFDRNVDLLNVLEMITQMFKKM